MPESALERRGFMARWKLNPHGSYTGAMSYEYEPAGAIWQSVTPSTVAPASFSNLPASLSRLAGCHPSPSSAARGVTAICVDATLC
jgi:hypothetical protein